MIIIDKVNLLDEIQSNKESVLTNAAIEKIPVYIKELNAKGLDAETLFIVINNINIKVIDNLICDNEEAVFDQYISTNIKVVIKNLDIRILNNLDKYRPEIDSVWMLPMIISKAATLPIKEVLNTLNIKLTKNNYGINIYNIFSRYAIEDPFKVYTAKISSEFYITPKILEAICGRGIEVISSLADGDKVVGIIDDLLPTITFVAFSPSDEE